MIERYFKITIKVFGVAKNKILSRISISIELYNLRPHFFFVFCGFLLLSERV